MCVSIQWGHSIGASENHYSMVVTVGHGGVGFNVVGVAMGASVDTVGHWCYTIGAGASYCAEW